MTQDVIDRDGFRANVGIVLMDPAGQLFLGRRTGGKGWQFPQGGMRRGETAEESLFRELREEIGLESARRQGARRDFALAALPAAIALCAARPASAVRGPEAALVPVAAGGR